MHWAVRGRESAAKHGCCSRAPSTYPSPPTHITAPADPQPQVSNAAIDHPLLAAHFAKAGTPAVVTAEPPAVVTVATCGRRARAAASPFAVEAHGRAGCSRLPPPAARLPLPVQ